MVDPKKLAKDLNEGKTNLKSFFEEVVRQESKENKEMKALPRKQRRAMERVLVKRAMKTAIATRAEIKKKLVSQPVSPGVPHPLTKGDGSNEAE